MEARVSTVRRKVARARATSAGTQSMTEQAYRLLEERIVTLQLPPGEFLSEYQLSDQLGLGRTPIREALQRLAREGLVSILPRRGILVAPSDPREQLLVLEVRRELERLLSRAAAARSTADERLRFRSIAEGMDGASATNNDIAFMRLDRDLNQLVLDAAHNEFAARAMRLLQGLSRRFWYQHYKEAADLPLCARLHAEQARAIAAGDARAAAEACDRLMDYVESFTRATA
jgi:DNA-binding GntR family transcriptional regulator